MPKRKSNEDSDEYIARKIKKLEKKLKKRLKRSKRVISSSSSSSPEPVLIPECPSLQEDVTTEEVHVTTESSESPIKATLSTLATQQENVDINTCSEEFLMNTGTNDDDTIILDEEILSFLGDAPSKNKKYGPKIQKDISLRWEYIAVCGLSKENKKELLDKYLVPENCKKIDAPIINPEVKAALSEMLAKKDKALEYKQKSITAAISCLSQAMTHIFSQPNKDPQVVKQLIEAGRIMCDIQYNESMNRRRFICSSIKKEVRDHLFNTEIDTFLFGEKLPETLKAAKAIHKSGTELKAAQTVEKPMPPKKMPATLNLNSRPQLVNRRQPPAMRRFEPAPGPSRQRPMLPPPPPPPRRSAPPQSRIQRRR